MGITVKKCVSNHGVQHRPGNKLIGIGEPGRYSASAIVRGRALRDQRIDVGEVEFHGKSVDIEIQHVPRRKNHLNVGEGSKASRFDLIHGKRQPSHRLFPQFVRNLFGEIHLVLDERATELKPRCPVGESYEAIVFPAERRDKIAQLVFPCAGGRHRFDGCQATCETSVLGTLRQTVNSHGLNDVHRNGNREASGNRVHVLRGVHHQHSLAFCLALERQLTRVSSNDPWYQR